MSLDTGGSTTTTTPQNTSAQQAALGQINTALGASGGLGQFAQPSNLFNLTPAENTYRAGIMGASLPGAMATQASSYTRPGGMFGDLFSLSPDAAQAQQAGVQGMQRLTDPTGGLFKNYLKEFVQPSVINNAIASGYGGASGASMEAMSRAGTEAAMKYGAQYPGMVSSAIQNAQLPRNLQLQGLTSLGLPLAQQDYANLQTGENAAGQQRNLSLQDLGRVQQLLMSMLGMLPTSTPGSETTNRGPGTAASLLNFGAGALGNLFNGGLAGSAGSLGAQGLSSLYNWATQPSAYNYNSSSYPDPSSTLAGYTTPLPENMDWSGFLGGGDAGGGDWGSYL